MKKKMNRYAIVSAFIAPVALFVGACSDKQDTGSANTTTGQGGGVVLSSTNSDQSAGVNTPGIIVSTNSVKADNTRNNAGDGSNTNLTSFDQGGSAADRTTSASIRRLLVSGNSDLSTAAKNIKIITTGGKVTLRGAVENDAEKTKIESIAKQVAGDGNVDDQLSVKAQ